MSTGVGDILIIPDVFNSSELSSHLNRRKLESVALLEPKSDPELRKGFSRQRLGETVRGP